MASDLAAGRSVRDGDAYAGQDGHAGKDEDGGDEDHGLAAVSPGAQPVDGAGHEQDKAQ